MVRILTLIVALSVIGGASSRPHARATSAPSWWWRRSRGCAILLARHRSHCDRNLFTYRSGIWCFLLLNQGRLYWLCRRRAAAM